MRERNEESYQHYLKILSNFKGRPGSTVKGELEDFRFYMGHVVTSNGLIIGPKRVVTPKIKHVRRKRKDGTSYITGGLYSHEVTIPWKGKYTHRTYPRFLYAAFNEDFDINDRSLVITSTSELRFDKNPYNYEALTREQWAERIGQIKRLYEPEERRQIYEAWLEVEGHISREDFASRIGTSHQWLTALILEERSNDKDSNTNS